MGIIKLFVKVHSNTVCQDSQDFSKGDFLGVAVVKNPPTNAGDTGSSLSPGRSHMSRSN